MDFLSWHVLVIAAPAVMFSAVSKAGFGSGASFAGASILALILEPTEALAIVLPLLLLIDIGSLPAYWRKWYWPDTKLLLIGSLPGVALGILFIQWADEDSIRLLIGAVCFAFVMWQALQSAKLFHAKETRLGPIFGLLTGMATAFTSFVSHAGGPIAIIYLLRQGLDKTRYQATTVIVFWAINVAKCAAYGAIGVFTLESLTFSMVLAPFALLGTWLGIRAHGLFPERAFFAVTYLLLMATGGKLIWDALT